MKIIFIFIYFSAIQYCSILFGTELVQNGKRPVNNTRQVIRAITNDNYAPFGGYENDIALLEVRTISYRST